MGHGKYTPAFSHNYIELQQVGFLLWQIGLRIFLIFAKKGSRVKQFCRLWISYRSGHARWVVVTIIGDTRFLTRKWLFVSWMQSVILRPCGVDVVTVNSEPNDANGTVQVCLAITVSKRLSLARHCASLDCRSWRFLRTKILRGSVAACLRIGKIFGIDQSVA